MTNLTRTGGHVPAKSLASIVARAKSTIPADTGAAARSAERIRSRPALAIIADTSRSMDRSAGGVRRIDALRQSLDVVLADTPSSEVIAFHSVPTRLAPRARLPEPDGGTALHLALDIADSPHVLVISDGQPDSESRALIVADRMARQGVVIDTLFIGDDSDTAAIAFMRQLAATGRGRAVDLDVSKSGGDTRRLASAIRLLAAPK
ncbi:MAG: VWA domain-containing protein [Sphingomonadales bacterium]|nr:VWA domain-containing protein [Sphingomonadales bacterium]